MQIRVGTLVTPTIQLQLYRFAYKTVAQRFQKVGVAIKYNIIEIRQFRGNISPLFLAFLLPNAQDTHEHPISQNVLKTGAGTSMLLTFENKRSVLGRSNFLRPIIGAF
jgi:hypothetical protein